MNKKPSFWIIILNCKQKELTASCLKTIKASDCREINVLIVDNASSDGSSYYFKNEFPWAKLLVNDDNLGFTGGNNVGIRYALEHGADLIWLLNNDTEIAPDCISKLTHASIEHPEYSLFAPKIFYSEPSNIIWYAGGNACLNTPSGVTHIGIGKPDGNDTKCIKEISFVTGCAFLIRRKTIDKIGLLDEELFIYYEDLDWSIKAKKNGYKALFIPDAIVWHKVSQFYKANKLQYVKTYLMARNRFIVQKQHSSFASFLMLFPIYLLGNVARKAYSACFSGDFQQVVALFLGIFDGALGRSRRYPQK